LNRGKYLTKAQRVVYFASGKKELKIDFDRRPSIDERYASACNTTSLHVIADKGGAGDVLIASGWSPTKLGSALLRLHSEWDGTAKLPKVTPEAITQVARTMQGTPAEKLAKAQKIAADWHSHECRLLAQRLKTLAAVREAATQRLNVWGAINAKDVAAEVLMHWLHPVCNVCAGQKFELIPGTPSLSTKACKGCRAAGRAETPHGEIGKRLQNYLDDCVSAYVTKMLHNRA
jgi:hypothetical protein